MALICRVVVSSLIGASPANWRANLDWNLQENALRAARFGACAGLFSFSPDRAIPA